MTIPESKVQMNEYCRDDAGNIFIVKKIEWDEEVKDYWYDDDIRINPYGGTFGEEVDKHSFNLIDIIEIGDYVNGELIDEKWYDFANEEWRLYNRGNLITTDKHIKSIVTKESFKDLEYRIDN